LTKYHDRLLVSLALVGVLGCGDASDAGEPDARAVTLECDPGAQDCPSGQKCSPTGSPAPWDGTTCVPDNAGTGSPPATPCFTGPDATDTCDETSMCMQLGTGEGACTSFCTDTPADTCGSGERCVLYDDALGLMLCAEECDLAAPDCALFYKCIDTLAGPACIPQTLQDIVPTA
jgi:hypothetical protein